MTRQMKLSIKVLVQGGTEDERKKEATRLGEELSRSLVGTQDFIDNNILVEYRFPGEVHVYVDEDCKTDKITIPLR